MNIYEEVLKVNSAHPDKRALAKKFSDGRLETYTYGEMFKKVDAYADILSSAGLKEGDRIAIAAESMPEWVITFLAIAKLHCTSVLIDASLTGGEIKEFIDRADPRAVAASPSCYEKLGNLPDYPLPVFDIYNGVIFDGSLKEISASVPATPDGDSSVATIIYSSGTTRKPAAIMHYHDSLINTTRMTVKVQGLDEDDRYLSIVPNSHIYGVICLMLGPALTGADAYYIDGMSADAILGAFADYHPTVFLGVPKAYELFMTQIMKKINSKALTRIMFKTFFPVCLKKRKKNGNMLGKKLFKSIHDGFGGSLEFLCTAGAPTKKEVAEFFYGTGFNLIITYGASETNIPTIGNRPENLTTHSCGVPYPDIQTKITDEGELLIKSPYFMKGYFRDEQLTKEAFTDDGWFKTGDLVSVDENGFYSVTGRSKENIVLASGKKATPEDIEEKYIGIEHVKEFVICGVPAENADYDEVHAFVIPDKFNEETENSIKEHFRQIAVNLPVYMKIAHFHFVDEIPRTSIQKPKRFLLKQAAIDERNGIKKEIAKPERSDDNTLSRIIKTVCEVANANESEVDESTVIFRDLAIDSLSAINLAVQIEDKFGKNIEPYYNDTMTVGDIAEIIDGKGDRAIIKEIDASLYPQEKDDADYRRFAFFKNLAKSVYRIHFYGDEVMKSDKGFVVCANHVSAIDFLYVASAMSKERYKKTCVMAKKELFKDNLFLRKLIKSTGMVPVDRSGMNMNTMNSICEKLKKDWCVVVHPEGTRSEDGVFRTMKSGACVLATDAGVPVIPVYIDGAFETFPKGRKIMRFFDWKHMKPFRINVLFGDPISSDGLSAQELSDKVQSAILALQDRAKAMK